MTLEILASAADAKGILKPIVSGKIAAADAAAVDALVAKWAGKIAALAAPGTGEAELVQILAPHGPVFERWVAKGAYSKLPATDSKESAAAAEQGKKGT